MPGPRTARGRAPGKVILLGEHAVVHGWPAIALPVNRWVQAEVSERNGRPTGAGRPECTIEPCIPPRELLAMAGRTLGRSVEGLDVSITSNLPAAMGLGSSAAVSVALIRALAAYYAIPLSHQEASDCAYALECRFHGQPSGIDNTTVAYATLLRFVRGGTPTALELGQALSLLVVVGRQPRATRSAIELLQLKRARNPQAIDAAFARIGALVDEATSALEQGNWTVLARCMNENHAILADLGVSTPELDELVREARAQGAWAAKLTGGGGGGAIVCLCPENRHRLVRHFRRQGWDCWALDWPPQNGGSYERNAKHCLRAI